MRKIDWLFIVLIFAACCTIPRPQRPEKDVAPELLNKFGDAVVKITPPNVLTTGGTGFYLRAPSGQIITVTNGHVCELSPDKHWLQATDDSGNGRELLEIKEISETADLCILSGPRVAPRNLPQLSQYQNRTRRLWALGHPFLKPNTLTDGYIVGFDEITMGDERSDAECKPPTRHIEEGQCIRSIWGFETSIVIYPGNSGSPVLTDEGEVVGVMFAGDRRSNRGVFISLLDLRELVDKY